MAGVNPIIILREADICDVSAAVEAGDFIPLARLRSELHSLTIILFSKKRVQCHALTLLIFEVLITRLPWHPVQVCQLSLFRLLFRHPAQHD